MCSVRSAGCRGHDHRGVRHAATAEGRGGLGFGQLWQALQSLYGPTMSYESLISGSGNGKPGGWRPPSCWRPCWRTRSAVRQAGGRRHRDGRRGADAGMERGVPLMSWTRSGASTSTRWITSRRASAARWYMHPLVECPARVCHMFNRMKGIREETIRRSSALPARSGGRLPGGGPGRG